MKAQVHTGQVFTAFARVPIFGLLAALLASSNSEAAPRPPQPPWPQATLQTYSFDAAYWHVPWKDVAINEDASTLADSWSGYSLVRAGFVSSPVLIPVGASKATYNVAVPEGAIRFWIAPNWSTVSEQAGGKGPGHLARLLELVRLDAKTSQVQWSLYVNEAGDTIYLSGLTKAGVTDLIKVPVTFSAGDWSMVTIAYSATKTVLWLNNELIGEGAGLPLLPFANPADLALVVGSDVYGSADSLAGAQFEELTTFEQWPKQSDWQEFYFRAYKRHSQLGPISDEEAAALAKNWAELKAQRKAAGDSDDGAAMMRFASSGPSSVCVTNGPVFMTNVVSYYTTNSGWTVGFDIVGGTNGVPYDIYSTTNLIGNHITNAVWQWEDVGATCHSYTFTNQPDQQKYFILGTTNDTDSDLLTDAYELLVSKTLVNDSDTDNDGLPDGWEVHNGLNPLDAADASDDPDGDWLTNLQEYNGGTNSSNPNDLMVVAWGDNTVGQCNVPLNLRNVKAIAAGDYFSLALRTDGTVVGWGANDVGQTNIPTDLTNAAAISANFRHAVAVRTNGTISMWGKWWHGSDYSLSQPADLTNVAALAAGGSHDLALRSNGVLTAWSAFGSTPFTTIPTNVVSPKSFAAGYSHSVAVLSNGTVAAWGENLSGLGWNVTDVPIGLSNVTSVAAGDYHTLALKANGTVTAWGAGKTNGGWFADQGQSIVPNGLSNVIAVTAAGYHSMALRNDGAVISWGDMPSPSFLQSNVIAIASGLEHGLGLRTGRQLPVVVEGPLSQVALPGTNVTFTTLALGLAGVKYQWQFSGTNITGQTNATLTLNSISTNSEGGYTVVFSTGAGSITSSVATLTVVRPPQIISVSPAVSSFVWVTTNATLSVVATAPGTNVYPLHYQWFRNGAVLTNLTSSQLGLYLYPFTLPTAFDGEYSVLVTNALGSTNVGNWSVRALLPGMVGGWGTNSDGQVDRPAALTNTVSLSAGKYHSIAAREDGGVNYWGYTWASLPTDLTNIISVSAGYAHTLVLRSDGSVTTWGQAGTYANVLPSNNYGMKAISAGTYHNVGLLTNGTVTAWGLNGATLGWHLTEVPANLTNATAVAAGFYHSVALRTDGTVISWGYNSSGQTNVPSGLTNAVAVAAGERFSLALRANGTITAWGENSSGECNVPAGLSNVMMIAAGRAHGVALKNDGSLVCWGDNSGSQTNTIPNLPPVKLIAAGGNHTLISLFSPVVQYPVDVSKDLLLIYNTNSIASSWVKDYYLAHRPMVSGANVLGISFPTNEYLGRGVTESPSLTNNALNPYLQWLAQNATKRPQYLVWFYDLPVQVVDGGTNHLWSPSYYLHTLTPGINPFVTCINMRTTNDCKAYIDKLEFFGTNYSPGKLFISARAGGYGNTNFVLDGIRKGGPSPLYENFSGDSNVVASAKDGLLAAGVPTNSILFYDGLEIVSNSVLQTVTHPTGQNNLAGYFCWGAHSSLGGQFAINGAIHWGGESKWWVIETIESYNGQRDNPNTGQSNFLEWFSANAFGGTNYANTPIGAVSHVEEPSLVGVNNAYRYFGLWSQGKTFSSCAWNSRNTPFFQAVGDPFASK